MIWLEETTCIDRSEFALGYTSFCKCADSCGHKSLQVCEVHQNWSAIDWLGGALNLVDTTGIEPAYRCNRGITTGRSVVGKRAPASNPYAEQSPASSTIPSRSLRQRPVLSGPPFSSFLGGGIHLPTCPCLVRSPRVERGNK